MIVKCGSSVLGYFWSGNAFGLDALQESGFSDEAGKSSHP